MATETAVPLQSLSNPLHDSIHELRRSYQSISECLEQSMADCDQKTAELVECRTSLAEVSASLHRSELKIADQTAAETALRQQIDELTKCLSEARTELNDANELIALAQNETDQSKQRLELQVETSAQLQSHVDRLACDLEAARAEAQQQRLQLSPLLESATEAARLRGELEAAKAEIARYQAQLGAGSPHEELKEQLSAALAERSMLESELDQLRNRGAELTEALAEQKRLVNEKKDQWTEELRQLRRAVERQSEMLAQRTVAPTNGQAAAAAPAEAPAARNGSGGDRVVDSVLQQFEMLQKDKLRQRTSSTG